MKQEKDLNLTDINQEYIDNMTLQNCIFNRLKYIEENEKPNNDQNVRHYIKNRSIMFSYDAETDSYRPIIPTFDMTEDLYDDPAAQLNLTEIRQTNFDWENNMQTSHFLEPDDFELPLNLQDDDENNNNEIKS